VSLDRRRYVGTLLSFTVAGGVGYWWRSSGESAHETIIVIVVFVVTVLVDVIFLIAQTCDDLKVSVKRLEDDVSRLVEEAEER